MTPLQQAAQALINYWGCPKPADITALEKALADEQAQAVEPVITDECGRPVTYWGGKANPALPPAELPAGECYRTGNTCAQCGHDEFIATPPAAPITSPAVTGERAELIARLIRKADAWDYLQPGAKRLNACRQAADMLKADASRITELESSLNFYQRRVELLQTWQSKMRDPERTIACDIIANGQTLPPENAGDRYKIPVEAQQLAVPTGWALVPIEPTPAILDAMSSSGWKTACYKAMLAAAQGTKLVTKKDSKTDWSAA